MQARSRDTRDLKPAYAPLIVATLVIPSQRTPTFCTTIHQNLVFSTRFCLNVSVRKGDMEMAGIMGMAVSPTTLHSSPSFPLSPYLLFLHAFLVSTFWLRLRRAVPLVARRFNPLFPECPYPLRLGAFPAEVVDSANGTRIRSVSRNWGWNRGVAGHESAKCQV